MLCGLGLRLLILFRVMLPVVVAGMAIWWAIPYLDGVGLNLDPLEVKRFGTLAVKVIIGFWLIIALSTWLRARLRFDVADWIAHARKTDQRAVAFYLSATFLGICYFVASVVS